MREIEARILHTTKLEYDNCLSLYNDWKTDTYESINWDNIRLQKNVLIKKIKRNYDEIEDIRVSISREIEFNRKPSENPTLIRKIKRHSRKNNVLRLDVSEIINKKDVQFISYEIEYELVEDFNIENINYLISETKKLISILRPINRNSIYNEINKILNYDLKFSLNKPKNIKFSDITDKLLNYGITIKADGIRHFLYTNENGAYLIGKEINKISDDNFKRNLFDAEVVKDTSSDDITLYIIDMIIEDGISISNLKLSERYEKFIEFDIGKYRIKKKEFRFPTKSNSYFKNVKYFLDHINDIPSDGIIFTPNNYYGFPSILKWKPLEKLTIDVKLGINKLYVMDRDKEVEFNIGADISELFRYNEGSIVEIKYIPEENKFIMYRMRTDVDVPNDLKTAYQIWNQLQNPITENDLLSKNLTLMRKYHNRIKFSIYNYLKDMDKNIIIDVGSGRGGDILKWKENNLFVIAVEPNEDNIDEFTKRLSSIQYDNIKLVKSGLEDYKYTDKVKAITFFNSVTFFTVEQITNFLDKLQKDGILIVMGMDSKKLRKVFPNDTETDNYSIKYINDNKIIIDIKDSIVRNQEENLFDFDTLKNNMKDYVILNDFYLNDERLMSKESKNLSKCYRTIFFWKRPTRILRETETLDIDEIAKINKSIFGNNAVRIGTIGDGSCFFHAILTSIDDEYINMNKVERKRRIKELRKSLSEIFTEDEYMSLANGNIYELGKTLKRYSYDRMLKTLQDTKSWIGNEFLDFICKNMYLNIYIITDKDWSIYKQGIQKEYIYDENRPTVIILWQGGIHYETFGIYDTIDKKIQVLFEPSNQISKMMYFLA